LIKTLPFLNIIVLQKLLKTKGLYIQLTLHYPTMKTNKEKILDFLKKEDNIINLTELAQRTKISYSTVLKYIEILEIEGKIDIKDYGNVKLVSIKRSKNK